MESEGKKLSDREKNEASIKLLEKLRERLYSSNPSIRRQAAFHLSWMQEDGLEILKGALFGDVPKTAKNAAAYGLRKMRGRMKKMSLEVLEQGLHQHDRGVREVCRRSLLLMGKIQEPTAGKLEIREIPQNRRPKRRFEVRQVRQQRFARNQEYP